MKVLADLELAKKESSDLAQQLSSKDKLVSQLEEQLKAGTNQLQ